jgi:hypothetical protein
MYHLQLGWNAIFVLYTAFAPALLAVAYGESELQSSEFTQQAGIVMGGYAVMLIAATIQALTS